MQGPETAPALRLENLEREGESLTGGGSVRGRDGWVHGALQKEKLNWRSRVTGRADRRTGQRPGQALAASFPGSSKTGHAGLGAHFRPREAGLHLRPHSEVVTRVVP